MRLGLLGAAVAALTLLAAGPGLAADRHVRVVNKSSQTMVKFQASNETRNSWEEDILGKDVLKPGQSVNVNLRDGTGACMFDLRATFKSGAEVVRRKVNVCKVGKWTITD